ncbi:hypothetical protein M0T31_24565, partial [Salmonella enterica]|nr:hypothetical protein [Salmonella enterica]
ACPTPRRPGKNFPIDPTFLFTCDVNVWIFFPGLPILMKRNEAFTADVNRWVLHVWFFTRRTYEPLPR